MLTAVVVLLVIVLIIQRFQIQELRLAVRALWQQAEELKEHTRVGYGSKEPIGDIIDDLRDRIVTIETDIGTWIGAHALSDSIDSLQNRIGALEEGRRGNGQDALASTVPPDRVLAPVVAAAAILPPGSKDSIVSLIRQVTPSPLKRVYEFTLSLSDDFWLKTLALQPSELAQLRRRRTSLERVVVEHWVSHLVVRTGTLKWSADEVPPTGEATRVEHVQSVYELEDDLVIWDLLLGSGARLALRLEPLGEEPPSLRLFAVHGRFGTEPFHSQTEPKAENVFLRLSLLQENLKTFKRPDEPDVLTPHRYEATPQLTCYEGAGLGIEWELWLHDLDAARAARNTEGNDAFGKVPDFRA